MLHSSLRNTPAYLLMASRRSGLALPLSCATSIQRSQLQPYNVKLDSQGTSSPVDATDQLSSIGTAEQPSLSSMTSTR